MSEITIISLCFFGGLFAGVINTLAGSGSLVTLSLLSFLGLPSNVANGTNRIGLFFQGATGTAKFYQQEELDLKGKLKLIFVTLLGATLGIWLASVLNVKTFDYVIGFIFLSLFFVVLLQPEKRITSNRLIKQLMPLIFFVIGFYAGFIQAGAGVFMLAVMHAVWGKSLTKLNPLKVFIIFSINILALIGYSLAGLVDWELGIYLGIGQIAGALIGVRLNSLKKGVEPVIRFLLLVLILVSVVKFWNIF